MPHSSVSFILTKYLMPIHCWTNDMISEGDKDKLRLLKKNVRLF